LPSMMPPPPVSPLFPYTTLFRSERFRRAEVEHLRDGDVALPLREEHVRGLQVTMHDAGGVRLRERGEHLQHDVDGLFGRERPARSEEHTSELQSRSDLVCRLLLE